MLHSLLGDGGVNSTYETLWEGSNARHPQLGNTYHLHKPKFSLWKLVTEIQSLTAASQASFPAPTAREDVIPTQGHKSASSREETCHSVIVHLFFIRTGSIFEAKEFRNKGEDV